MKKKIVKKNQGATQASSDSTNYYKERTQRTRESYQKDPLKSVNSSSKYNLGIGIRKSPDQSGFTKKLLGNIKNRVGASEERYNDASMREIDYAKRKSVLTKKVVNKPKLKTNKPKKK